MAKTGVVVRQTRETAFRPLGEPMVGKQETWYRPFAKGTGAADGLTV